MGALSPAFPSDAPIPTSLQLGLVLSQGHPFISMTSARARREPCLCSTPRQSPEGPGEASEEPAEVPADRTSHYRYQAAASYLGASREGTGREVSGSKALPLKATGTSLRAHPLHLQYCTLAAPSRSVNFCTNRNLAPRVGPRPRVGVALLGVYTSIGPIFKNPDAELSGKRTIHSAKELRFPHFFEGCVLLR